MIGRMLSELYGKTPRWPIKMIFFLRSVLAVLDLIPRARRNLSNVRKARRPTFLGARAPKSPKHPIKGKHNILLNRTSGRREKRF